MIPKTQNHTQEEISQIIKFYLQFPELDAEKEVMSILNEKKLKVARIIYNRFSTEGLGKLISNKIIEYDDGVVIETKEAEKLSRTKEFLEGKFYILSFPSYLVIKSIPIDDVEYGLDLCASPGGKGLHLYDRFDRKRPVIMNEPSANRRKKMMSVLKLYGADNLPIMGIDGGRLCRFVCNRIPVIIADVPCTGDEHILANPKRLKEWKPRQSEILSKRQFAILSSAFYAIREGGFVLYSTCTISPIENEYVISRLLEKFADSAEIVNIKLHKLPFQANLRPIGNVSANVLRFRAKDFGTPFFAALIRKTKEIYPKRKPNPYPVYYRDGRLIVGKREFSVPNSWNVLPELPYVSVGSG